MALIWVIRTVCVILITTTIWVMTCVTYDVQDLNSAMIQNGKEMEKNNTLLLREINDNIATKQQLDSLLKK